MASAQDGTILLLGGTGKVASRIATLLYSASYPILLAHRSNSPPPTLPNVPVSRFDWLDATTYSNPFEQASNIQSVFLVAPPVMDMFSPMKDFIDLAISKGVKRFVLLSSNSLPVGGPAMGAVHEYLVSSDVDYAILRPTWFMENFSEHYHYTQSILNSDSIHSATGNGKVAFVSAEDIAAVGFHALTDQTLHTRDFVILGPELLSFDDVAEIIGKVIGRKIVHVKISGEESVKRYMGVGMSEEYAEMLTSFEEAVKGCDEQLNDVVYKVTGKQPGRFIDFAEGVKAAWTKEN